MTERQLGPIMGATILCNDLEQTSAAYQQQLKFTLAKSTIVSPELAKLWHSPALAGQATHILQAANGDAWLRLIQSQQAPAKPLSETGWAALEILVADVDAIYSDLSSDYFAVIGKPAFLAVSDAIKAMQVTGKAGEVCYLTQILAQVPPFELPMTTAYCAGLFIPVLCCHDRAETVAFYEKLNQADKALQFDTRITVLNQHHKQPEDHLYKVATLQLEGQCLIEIDQVPEAASNTSGNQLPAGIAMVSFYVKDIEAVAKAFNQQVTLTNDSYYRTEKHIENKVLMLKGPAGEFIELIQH